MTQQKYKDWDLLDQLPIGWKIDKSAGSPLCGYEFCTNGSILNGGKRALVIVDKQKNEITKTNSQIKHKEVINKTIQVIDKQYLKTVNILARKKFEESMLKDIMIDLTVCDIEGWSKKEYINELKRLIDSLVVKQLTLF